MEILMQWLDDLEDLVFAAALAWHRLCRVCLALGFAASVLVVAPGPAGFASLVALTAVAAVSVLAWSTAVVTTFVLSTRSLATSA